MHVPFFVIFYMLMYSIVCGLDFFLQHHCFIWHNICQTPFHLVTSLAYRLHDSSNYSTQWARNGKYFNKKSV